MRPTSRPQLAAGQEWVWDCPRPPRVEATTQQIRIVFNGVVIAETTTAQRVLETSHPPTYYIPPADIAVEYLTPSRLTTVCEFKGRAGYCTIRVGDRVAEDAAWRYADPRPGYESIKNHVAFYPSRMDLCMVDGEPVKAQPGDFYGGWITAAVIGPFKGRLGTKGW